MQRKIEHFTVQGFEQPLYNFNTQLQPFSQTVTYVNHTADDITVVMRNNLTVTIPAAKQPYGLSPALLIRTTYLFNNKDAMIITMSRLHGIIKESKVPNHDIALILEAFRIHNNNTNGSFSTFTVTIDRSIDHKTITSHAAIFEHETDILILNPRNLEFTPHPYSHEGMMIDGYKEFVKKNNVSGVFIELIDNNNKISDRYMYLAKHLIQLTPTVDKDRKSGVYFTVVGLDFTGEISIDPEFIEFTEAENKIGLFKNEEEAISGGDPSIISRSREEELKREFAEFKRNTEIEKTKAEREHTELQIALDEIRAKRTDFYEERKLRRTDAYDEVSYTRKDNSEFIKFFATAVAAVVTTAAVLHRSKK
jgi:hypothetical protein